MNELVRPFRFIEGGADIVILRTGLGEGLDGFCGGVDVDTLPAHEIQKTRVGEFVRIKTAGIDIDAFLRAAQAEKILGDNQIFAELREGDLHGVQILGRKRQRPRRDPGIKRSGQAAGDPVQNAPHNYTPRTDHCPRTKMTPKFVRARSPLPWKSDGTTGKITGGGVSKRSPVCWSPLANTRTPNV